MKKSILKNIYSRIFFLFVCAVVITSCNKDLPDPVPIIPPAGSGLTVGATVNNDTSYSIFKAAATRVGILAALSDSSREFTLFLPDNNAFRLSGVPSADVIAVLPIETVGAIVNYHIIPGQQIPSSAIADTFPNIQEPSYLTIGTLPGTTIPLQLSVFPSRRATGLWLNNIPVTEADILCRNGVIHKVAAIVNPPSQVLAQIIYTNPDLTYFTAAIARADSGQEGLNRFDSLLKYPVTNMTVLAPNNAAFQALLFGNLYAAFLAQGLSPGTASAQATFISSTPDVFANPALYGTLTSASIRGLIAYHLLATPNPLTGAFEPNVRAFSVNFSSTPSFVTTLVNSEVEHPGILVTPTFTGPIVADLKFTGLGTFPPGGAPYSGEPATAVSKDIHGVNGVVHIIDKVLLPQ